MRWSFLVALLLLAGCTQPAAPPLNTGHEVSVSHDMAANDSAAKAISDPSWPFTADMRQLLHAVVNSTLSPLHVEGRRLVDATNERLVTGFKTESRDFNVELRPSQVARFTQVETNGTLMPLQGVLAFEGNVVGSPDMLVRLTVAHSWARGAVRDGNHTYEIRIGELPSGLAPSSREPSSIPIAQGSPAFLQSPPTAGSATGGPPDALTCTSDPLVGGERDPRTFKLVAARGRSRDTILTAHLALDAEPDAVHLLGNDTVAFAVFAAQEMDLVYQYEVGVRYNLTIVALESTPLAHRAIYLEMADRWGHKVGAPPRDLTLLFDPSFGGGEGGAAQCIGSAGYAELANAVISIDASHLEESHFLDYLLTHESAHLFNAMHIDGNAHESDAGTIMYQGVVASGFNLVFGTMERSYIRGWAETHLPN